MGWYISGMAHVMYGDHIEKIRNILFRWVFLLQQMVLLGSFYRYQLRNIWNNFGFLHVVITGIAQRLRDESHFYAAREVIW